MNQRIKDGSANVNYGITEGSHRMMRKIRDNDKGFQNLVPMILAVILTFAILAVGIFVIGTIGKQVYLNSMTGHPTGKSWTSQWNFSKNRLNNTTVNFDSVLSVVNIAVIITILAAAIGAIFLFTRIGG